MQGDGGTNDSKVCTHMTLLALRECQLKQGHNCLSARHRYMQTHPPTPCNTYIVDVADSSVGVGLGCSVINNDRVTTRYLHNVNIIIIFFINLYIIINAYNKSSVNLPSIIS